MNAPQGFELVKGEVTAVDPIAAMFNPALFFEFVHMYVAFMAVGFLVAATYAVGMLRGRDDHYHRLGL